MTTIAKEKTQWGQGLDEFKSVLIDMLDFSFFGDIRFTLFALSNFLLYAWYDVPYVYLADNAVEIGFSETDASIFISLIGIVNMVGEIILGWFGDKKFMTAGMIYAVCMVFCGLVTGLVPLLPTFTVRISRRSQSMLQIQFKMTINLITLNLIFFAGIVNIIWFIRLVHCGKLCAHQYYFS